MQQGWIYVLTNQAMPGLVKIGFTKNPPHSRARELYDTGVAHPFEVAYQIRCRDYRAVERAVHEALSHCRVNERREFFACSVAEAVETVRRCAGDDVLEAHDRRHHAAAPARKSNSARHLLLGLGVFVLLTAAAWWWLADRDGLSEVQNMKGYTATKIGQADVNLRNCPSQDCAVTAVLPKRQVVLIQDKPTAGGWVYAQFQGDVCYPQHYKRGEGCRQWAGEHVIEGWLYAANLDGRGAKADSSGKDAFDALF